MAAKNTTTNLSPNVASALCYVPVIGWVCSIVLLLVEKSSAVKWNAIQSLLFHLLAFLIGWILPFILPFVGLGLNMVLAVAVLIVELFVAVKTYQGDTVKLPLLGSWTDKVIKKV